MKFRAGVLGLVLLAVSLALVASGSTLAQAETRVRASTFSTAVGVSDFGPSAAFSQLRNGQSYDETASVPVLAAEGGTDITSILSEHVAAGQARFAEEGFTEGQVRALADNPNLERAFTGERIDTFAKESAAADPRLQGIQITGRFQRGTDFIDPATGNWWDITTPGQWAAHVLRYGPGGTILPW